MVCRTSWSVDTPCTRQGAVGREEGLGALYLVGESRVKVFVFSVRGRGVPGRLAFTDPRVITQRVTLDR